MSTAAGKASDKINKCLVKYLYAPSVPNGLFYQLLQQCHNIQDYEFYTSAEVYHRNFEELQHEVLAHCPGGYRCKRPIAMHHELIWQFRKEERDELFQPIFDQVFFLCAYLGVLCVS